MTGSNSDRHATNSSEERAARRVIDELKRSHPTKKEFTRLKYRASADEGLRRVLKDHEVIKYLAEDEEYLAAFLRGKEVRSASGIYTVAVMTKPWRCPKEKPCLYCPGGIEEGTPQSYLGKEPALMRGVQTGFDPYMQVRYRLEQYNSIGHKPSKVQLIIMGGTFPATDLEYQEWFVTRCLEAMNDYPDYSPYRWVQLEDAQSRNGRSRVKCIGITMETRPDWAKVAQTDRMIRLGATLVEIGVQALDDAILSGVARGNAVGDVIEATRILRDSGLKVGYHIMPGLPGSNWERDLEDIRRIFEEEDFKPDYLKIYPTLVIEGTTLYDMWRRGEYRALATREAAELLVKAHRYFPKWVRVARIQRDVPAYIIQDGVKNSNLREIVEERFRNLGIKCRCIRCREVGLAKIRGDNVEDLKPEILRESYKAGGGTEEFISVEDKRKDLLVGFLRLRIPSEKAHRQEVKNSGVIRELHIYGQHTSVGERLPSGYQHRGWGSMLLQKAEELVEKEYGLRRIAVLPGAGVRAYYRQRGYRKAPSSLFMVKMLEPL